MKTKLTRIFLASCLAFIAFFSCKRSDNSIYYYSESRDTMAPEILPSVPTPNYIYSTGATVTIIGNVTDNESAKRGGKLKTMRIKLDQIEPSNKDSVLKTLKDVYYPVDGSTGTTYRAIYDAGFHSSMIYCLLTLTAKDYANREKIVTTKFAIQ